ncbi:MAG: hypothetical protein LBV12_07410, partial [Puniceicoccales bacterium]|nr:hypothetical protein [Puniceicoccales bacterium]
MRKLLAILCLLLAVVSLLWNALSLFLDKEPGNTQVVTTIAPDGTTTTETRTLGKIVTVNKLRAPEGLKL